MYTNILFVAGLTIDSSCMLSVQNCCCFCCCTVICLLLLHLLSHLYIHVNDYKRDKQLHDVTRYKLLTLRVLQAYLGIYEIFLSKHYDFKRKFLLFCVC